MKGQDILLMLRLVSLELSETDRKNWMSSHVHIPDDWRGWESSQNDGFDQGEPPPDDRYSVRGLAAATGISKSETSAALRRCFQVELVRPDRRTGHPIVNTKGLFEFISFGLKYVFPTGIGQLVKGIPTAAYAPVLSGQLFAGGKHPLVWEDPNGMSFGQRIEPLYKTVPYSVRRDPLLYALLALIDSIRLGHERESALSKTLLARYLGRVS